jgi:hypothetical protein
LKEEHMARMIATFAASVLLALTGLAHAETPSTRMSPQVTLYVEQPPEPASCPYSARFTQADTYYYDRLVQLARELGSGARDKKCAAYAKSIQAEGGDDCDAVIRDFVTHHGPCMDAVRLERARQLTERRL